MVRARYMGNFDRNQPHGIEINGLKEYESPWPLPYKLVEQQLLPNAEQVMEFFGLKENPIHVLKSGESRRYKPHGGATDVALVVVISNVDDKKRTHIEAICEGSAGLEVVARYSVLKRKAGIVIEGPKERAVPQRLGRVALMNRGLIPS